MTDTNDARAMVKRLRNCVVTGHNPDGPPIKFHPRICDEAADLIEALSAPAPSEEEEVARAICETLFDCPYDPDNGIPAEASASAQCRVAARAVLALCGRVTHDAIALNVLDERERCAKIADEFVERTNADIAHAIAAAIRKAPAGGVTHVAPLPAAPHPTKLETGT